MNREAYKKPQDTKRVQKNVDQSEIMQEVRDVNPETVRGLCEFYRSCSYVQAAAEKLHSVTLNGGICAKLGGFIDLPEFDRRTSQNINGNLRRALEWTDCLGFIPFSVEPPAADDETSGASIGFGSDEAECMTGKSAAIAGSYGDPGEMEGRIVDPDAKASDAAPPPPLRSPKQSMEPSDFDFMVPSLGLGNYQIYRDTRDQRLRVVRKRDQNTTGSLPGGSNGEEEAVPLDREPIWYVYVVEDPDPTGKPNSTAFRLKPHMERIQHLDDLDVEGARLGVRPIVVTQETTPGKGLRNLDNHRAYTTDIDSINIGAKDPKGMPVGFRYALDSASGEMRAVLEHHGIDPDTGVRDAKQMGAKRMQEHPIAPRRQLASVVTPTRFVDTSQKMREYISRVAVEFGVPSSDLSEVGSRYKSDRSQHAVSLIEKGRRMRTILTDLLYYVFDLRNGSRLQNAVVNEMGVTQVYLKDLEIITEHTKQLLEKARRGAAVPPPPPPQSQNPPVQQAAARPNGESQPTESNNKGDGTDTEKMPDAPEEAILPDDVQYLVSFVQQIQISYAHIGRVQSALDTMVKSERPLVICWKQPVIVDTSQIDITATALGYDTAQKADIARFHYGINT